MPRIETYEDWELMARLKENDTGCFLELYNRYHMGVYNGAIYFLKHPQVAEDVVQETFLKIWEIRHRLQPHLSFAAYLYRISRNISFKMLKKIANDHILRSQVSILYEIETNNPEKSFQWQEYQRLLESAINKLPDQRRKVFQLCRQSNKTYEEVASELGISRNTVKEHMVKAMQDIRSYFFRFGDVSLLLFLFPHLH